MCSPVSMTERWADFIVKHFYCRIMWETLYCELDISSVYRLLSKSYRSLLGELTVGKTTPPPKPNRIQPWPHFTETQPSDAVSPPPSTQWIQSSLRRQISLIIRRANLMRTIFKEIDGGPQWNCEVGDTMILMIRSSPTRLESLQDSMSGNVERERERRLVSDWCHASPSETIICRWKRRKDAGGEFSSSPKIA